MQTGVDGRSAPGLLIGANGSNLVAGTLATPDGSLFPMEPEDGSGLYLEVATQDAGELVRFTNGTYQVRLHDITGGLRGTVSAEMGGLAVTQTPQIVAPAALCLTNRRPTIAWAPATDPRINSGALIVDNHNLDGEEFFAWNGTAVTSHTVTADLFGAVIAQLLHINGTSIVQGGCSKWTGHLTRRWQLFNVTSNATNLAFARAAAPARTFCAHPARLDVFQFGFLPGTSCTAALRFGDGAVSSGWSAAHCYSSAGILTAAVVVADQTGLAATGTTVVTAYPLPLLTNLVAASNAHLALTFPAISGALYRVEARRNLRQPADGGLLALLGGYSSAIRLPDPMDPDLAGRVYQVACELDPDPALPATPFTTPYASESDQQGIHEAFSGSTNCPWGFAHSGIDFFPVGDGRTFQAVHDGTISQVSLEEYGAGQWQVSVRLDLDFDSRCQVVYAFEPMSTLQSDGNVQLSRILVSEGQHVARGEALGTLYTAFSGAHVDMGMLVDGQRVTPEPFFGYEARESILRLIRQTWGPSSRMTYE